MDIISQAMANMSLEPLKEPRGFIKCIQLIIAIFAFATTTSYSSTNSFQVTCTDNSVVKQSIKVSYPFKINGNQIAIPMCNGTIPTETISPYGDFSTSSEFYVFVGVMAFLYTIAALVVYIFFDDKYRDNEQIPVADFIVSVIFVLCWLISSSAWAQGVTDLKYYSNPTEFFYKIPDCAIPKACEAVGRINYASLNVSLIFGFLNTFVWGGNLWFLFKETKWHSGGSDIPPPHQPPPPMQQSPTDFPTEYPGQRI